MLGPGVVRPSVPRSLPPFRTHYPQVAEGGPAREPLQLLEVSPRKRLPAGPEQDPCGSRPAPEGAGAGAEQGHSAGGGGWCRHCHTKLAELKRQAWKLVSGPGTRLRVSGPSLGRPLRAGPVLELGRLWVAEGVFLASPYSSLGLLPQSVSVCGLGRCALRGPAVGLEGAGQAFLPELQMQHSWNRGLGWGGEGGGEGGSWMAGTPPRVGQLVLRQQQEVTWYVLALGAPGPSARRLEIAHLEQEGLDHRRVGPLLWGGAPCPRLASRHGRVVWGMQLGALSP